jgi:hypothetical protein
LKLTRPLIKRSGNRFNIPIIVYGIGYGRTDKHRCVFNYSEFTSNLVFQPSNSVLSKEGKA